MATDQRSEATYKLAKFFKENGFTDEQRKKFGEALIMAVGIATKETVRMLDEQGK